MPSLGERLAVAYGWRFYPNESVTLLAGWFDKDGNEHAVTDPENSWEDFGAMLEWAGAREPLATRRALTKFSFREITKPGPIDWHSFRRGVTEVILEALDA